GYFVFSKNQEYLDDIKTVFDAMRNVGICIALFAAGRLFDVHNPFGCWVDMVLTVLLYSYSAVLFLFNAYWLYWTLKGKPKSICYVPFSLVLLLTLAASGYGGLQLM
ncbi:hypothetical protein, partial [Salinivibrio sp. MA427]|uniref:hypothetical protein n=1 Tax=Salinivibrio sp. MA427 TaxID=1909455 RepID=UPI001F5BB8B1